MYNFVEGIFLRVLRLEVSVHITNQFFFAWGGGVNSLVEVIVNSKEENS